MSSRGRWSLRIGVAIPVVLALLLSPSIAFASEEEEELPTIDSESVSGITSTNAILEAQISPHSGNGADYQFQLVTDPEEYASEILCPYPPEWPILCIGPAAEGVLPIEYVAGEATQVSLDLSGEGGVTLQPGTTYHYRVLAARSALTEDTVEWEGPTVFGPDQTFTTPEEELPTIDKESVSGITSTNAILEAQISPHGGSADVQFQLVTDPEEYLPDIFCHYPPPESTPICLGEYAEGALPILNVFEEPTQVKLNLSKNAHIILTPGTTYHYRALAARAIFGEDTIEWEPPTVFGADQTFTTPGEEPTGPPLTLKIEEGEGTVVSNPAGLECMGAASHECTTEAIEEGPVTLTASPAPGYLFKSWKGCDTGGVNGRQCTINLVAGHKPVGAKFVKVWSLQGSRSGGPGTLTTSPGGLNCGNACSSSSALYREGALTVKEKPAKHFHFVEFQGTGSASSCDGIGGEGATCTFAISSDSAIEALYAEDAKHTLTLSKEGGGQGFVKTKPTSIYCGYACPAAAAEFFASEEPEVTVTLGKGTSSLTWLKGAGGCKEGEHQLTCKVPMGSAHELVAEFE